ncbi:hypothetical protein [uncultured Winogradskyella sp.]|uniref:hypothetical protein n=1 Tax=uncultured Winogradskyella sp. TaxID=395353 RepID=UPI00260A56D8|nr:hypothetical protein [uncultured Winogradskyella sp.]
MNFFLNLFKNSNNYENSKWILLRNALAKDINYKYIKKVYFLSAIEYDEKILNESKIAIMDNNLKDFLNGKKFNSLKDSIDFYFLEFKNNIKSICILHSPYELYENEFVIDLININFEVSLIDYEHSELIYNYEKGN